MTKSGWLQRRWFEFRLGHSNYWGFALSLVNFALIVYGFLFSEIDGLPEWLNNPIVFMVVLGVIYVPLNTITGSLHRRLQLKVDSGETFAETPQVQEILERLKRIEEKVEASN